MHTLLILTLTASLAAPPEPPPSDADVAAYCDHARSVAQSEAALLVAPDAIGGIGVAHQTEELFGLGPVDELHPRVTAGLRYSLASLRRGLLLVRRSDAECDRYRTVSTLREFLEVGGHSLRREPLKKRLAVLEAALPQAERLLSVAASELEAGATTASELDATALRLVALQADVAEARRELAAIPPLAASLDTLRGVHQGIQGRAADEGRVAEIEATMRKAEALDVEVRGGLDHVFGARDRIPLFGMVSVKFSLGALWRGDADARAVEARRAWARREVEGVGDRAGLALRDLRAQLDAERPRLTAVRAAAAGLRRRYEATASLQGAKVARYRDQLWFDLLEIEAEELYLAEHVAALAAFLEGA